MSAEGDTFYRLAGAKCIAAGSDHTDDWPCSGHLAEAARELRVSASASASVTGGSVAAGALADGAAGAPRPAASAAPISQTDNRPGGESPGAAYRPNNLGQNGR